jgi:hypothetical protein
VFSYYLHLIKAPYEVTCKINYLKYTNTVSKCNTQHLSFNVGVSRIFKKIHYFLSFE